MTTESVLREDMGLGGSSVADATLQASVTENPQVLLTGDKLFHLQSYDIGGGTSALRRDLETRQ